MVPCGDPTFGAEATAIGGALLATLSDSGQCCPPKSGETKAVKDFAKWCHANAKVLLWGSICFVAGVGVSVPLGWKLPDTISALFGSIAGAISAVGGAFLIWQAQDARSASRISDSIAANFGNLRSYYEILIELLTEGGTEQGIREISRITTLSAELATRRLQRFDESVSLLSVKKQQALFELHEHPVAMRITADDIARTSVWQNLDTVETASNVEGSLNYLISQLAIIALTSATAQPRKRAGAK